MQKKFASISKRVRESRSAPRFSPHRRDPQHTPHPHRPGCIGCPWMDRPYPQQLTAKREIVARALAAYPSLSGFPVAPVIASPERLGYRARVKLVVRRHKDDVAIGLYQPGSHHVMDISSCPVHPRAVNQVIHYLKGKIVELGITPYDERDDTGDLRYVDCRYSFSRRELSVTLVTRHGSFPRGAALARALQHRFSYVVGVLQNINEERGNVIWGKTFRTLAGRETILERVDDLKLVYPAGVFSQANPFAARKLYRHIADMARLSGSESVVDLYCGVGPIALVLASSAREVWGIDDGEEAIATAKQNARRNGLGNCRFLCGDVAERLAELKSRIGRIDLVIANPPRKGLQPAALDVVETAGAPKMIYVACNPQTQARDLDRLVRGGYALHSLQPFDMFPQTDQVETVAVLERNPAQ